MEPGRSYRLSAWCYADCGTLGVWKPGWHGAILEFFSGTGPDRRSLGTVSNDFGVLQEQWGLRQMTAVAPAGASVARVSIVAHDNGHDGALQFDDLYLEELPEEPKE